MMTSPQPLRISRIDYGLLSSHTGGILPRHASLPIKLMSFPPDVFLRLERPSPPVPARTGGYRGIGRRLLCHRGRLQSRLRRSKR